MLKMISCDVLDKTFKNGGRAMLLALLSLLALLGTASGEDAATPRVWTVFCAECTNNFDYK